MQREVTDEKLNKYFQVTQKAFDMALEAPKDETKLKEVEDVLDMVKRYISDAHYFKQKGNAVLAFAALNYAHGWLDAAARLKLFLVYDSTLFTVDEKEE